MRNSAFDEPLVEKHTMARAHPTSDAQNSAPGPGPSNLIDDIFSGGGETGALMRSIDWSRSALGPAERWPQSLRTALSILLESRFPMYIAWGPSFTQFYNDGYRPILGSTKHPLAMGGPAAVTFAESWHIIEPMFEGVREGSAVGSENWMLPLDRHGYLEECYFTYSYSPIRDESRGVGGVLVTVFETTERVLGERRLRTLRDLADRASTAKREQEVWKEAAAALAGNALDLPFALLYRSGGVGAPPSLMESVGWSADRSHEASRLASSSFTWPFQDAPQSGQLVADLGALLGALPGGKWPEAAHSALVLPIARPGSAQPYGFMVAGVSPRRALDDDYRGFLELCADRLSTAVTNARAFDDERRRAEALAEIDRAKTTFFSNVSHEFRTPLTLMLAPVEDILVDPAEPLSKAQRERLDLIRRNGLRLQKLVNSLLDFARIEAGRAQASFVPTDLGALTRDLVSSFDSAMRSAGLTLSVDCPPLHDAVYVDPAMWEKIVLNLLSNALKFTFKGSIDVGLRLRGERVELTVRDSGIGVSASELPRIFERFYRVEGAHGRSHEGSGIGLSLVQELVKLHGGQVSVESELGKGTTFTVSLLSGSAHLSTEHVGKARTLHSTGISPSSFLAEVAQWNGAESASVNPGAASGGLAGSASVPPPQARILVADDNADMRSYLCRLLSTHWQVEAVADGRQAFLRAQAAPPDLILSDVMMPVMGGLELARALRETDATKTVPLLLLSARAGEEATIVGLESGADEYLIKPFSAKELLARVNAQLTVSRLRQVALRTAREHAEVAARLASEAERATRSREETLGIVSHDLRSPLSAILTAAELLLSTAASEDAEARRRKHAEVIRRSAQRMNRLVDDLLDLASIDTGRLSLTPVAVTAGELVSETRDSFETQARGKGVALRADVASGLPLLRCDRERVCQALSNLISNALRFTPNGGTITLSAGSGRGGEAIRFTVSDTGTGIPPETLPHIFDRHWHAKQKNRSGHGLGLSIAKGIVESHGGEISVESTPGVGSTFSVSIPLEPGKPASVASFVASLPNVADARAAASPAPLTAAERRPSGSDNFIQGGGEMGALMRSIDWSPSPLGPTESWPQSLRTSVSTMLRSPYPIILFWGPERCMLYNDPFRPILGEKHPASMGARGHEALAEEWALLGPLMQGVLDTGEPVFIENGNVNFARRQGGLREEAYFTWSYNPTIGEAGEIVGLFAIASETTRQVVGDRQLRILRELSIGTALDQRVEEIFQSLSRVLSEAGHDLPFALLYVVSGDKARLVSCAGLGQGSLAAPLELVLGDTHSWPLAHIAESRQEQLLEHLDSNSAHFGRLPGGPWPEPATRALLLPIPMGTEAEAFGVLVAGLSPLRALDEEYRSFLQLLGRQLSASIASARAYEQEKQRAEDLAELDQAKTAFFSNVSHEFRTPLTLILGPVEDALSRSQPLQSEALEMVRRNALRLFKMVNTLLDFSRMEAGRAQATYVPTDLATFTKSLASAFQSAVESAGLSFVVDCAPLSEAIYVDPEMWEKIVLNLLSNAVKYTYRGEIRVELGWDGEAAVLSVRDTGTGIPEAELPRVFERFYRVRATQGRSHEGTGIGLALVQELVKLHGGRVAVSSTLGEGSTFTVRMPRGSAHLPTERVERTPRPRTTAAGAAPFVEEAQRWFSGAAHAGEVLAQSLDAEQREASPALSRARILLVDDNSDLRAYVAGLLRELYSNVATATNGSEALALVRQERPDLVLSDVMMPGLDGFGLVRELRADERTRGTPIILLSARAGDEATVEGLQSGADDYLVKPFSARELLARVRIQLEMTRVRRELSERALAEERLLETLRARDEWLMVVSHELRTPVSALSLSVQLLIAGLESKQLNPKAQAAQKQLQRVVRQVEHLIDVAELASGNPLELSAEELDLCDVARDVIADEGEKAARLGCSISLDASVPVLGLYDGARLRQLLHHLLDNALKFGAGKPVDISVGNDAEQRCIRVVDHGSGIEARDQERVFGRFERAAPVRKYGGFGLGLWMAREIATAHGGSISVSTTEGGGTTATVLLPAGIGAPRVFVPERAGP